MAPPTPAPQPSATPVTIPSPIIAEDPAPSTEPAILESQTDVTMGESDLDKGEPSLGNDPSTEIFTYNLLNNPGLAKLVLSRKSAEVIQRLAKECLEHRTISAKEEAQEAEDINYSQLLKKVRLRDEGLRAGVLPPPPVIPLTLAEKVTTEVNMCLSKLTHEHHVSRNSNS